MKTVSSLPEQLTSRAFTRKEALEAGLGIYDLQSERIVRRVARGVYVPAAFPPDERTRARALVSTAPPGSVLSGVAALKEAGIMLPRTMQDCQEIEILTPGRIWDRREPGLRTRCTSRPISLLRPGVAHPVHVLVRLGPEWTLEDRVVVADQILRRIDPLATLEELTRSLQDAGPGRGIRMAARVLELTRPRTDSPPETIMRLHIVGAGIRCPEVNCPVRDETDHVVAMPDLSFPELRIAAEYDGAEHRRSDRQRQLDNQRLRTLQSRGWTILVATAVDLNRPARFLSDLSALLPPAYLSGR